MHGIAMPTSARPISQTTRDIPADMAERLIVALDVSSPEAAERIVQQLDGVVSFFKIGLWLLFAEGTDRLIDKLVRDKKNVFLDYKMFDIGETVQRGVERARDRGIKFITVHGDDEIIKHAVEGKGDSEFLKIFTITVLTSLDDQDLQNMGYRWTVRELIENRVRSSLKFGSDGIIASASDNPNQIRRLIDNPGLLIATPGVRHVGAAIRDGADYIIMGRPIVEAQDPRAEAERAIADMLAGAGQTQQTQ